MAARKKTTTPAKSTAARAPRRKKAIPRLRIRLYRHGLGDCLLLRFARKGGKGTFNVLIDCGIHTIAKEPRPRMTAVVDDIAAACDSRLDVVVMTHEHWDHASGFSPQQVQAAFDAIRIGEVWYGWTEDPANKLGRKLRREREAKVRAVSLAAHALASLPDNALALERSTQLSSTLGFFGIDLAAAQKGEGKIGKTREAFEYLAHRRDVRVVYRHPDEAPVALPGVDGVRVYTLGPPQDEMRLKKSAPTKSESEVYELAAEMAVTANLENAFERLAAAGADAGVVYCDCPFDESWSRRLAVANPTLALADLMQATWDDPAQDWRRIDLDWTGSAEGLAIDLDSHTNNSCLVLAFEFADTGEVFLFPADAQVGNWLSWHDLEWKVKSAEGPQKVTARDLLSRTVFYKVGHHGSHNATLRELGLELMGGDDLVAFVPVVREEAARCGWDEMPFLPLAKRLSAKTKGRVLYSDMNPPTKSKLDRLSAAEQKRFLGRLSTAKDGLFFELAFD